MSKSLSARARMVADFESQVGVHDQPRIYGGPAGDLGIVGGPDSISWRLHSDVASVAIAGAGAIIMETLHPSVMAGVQDHSSYATDPYRRARTTYGYVVGTTFGNSEAAEGLIAHVRRMHEGVTGTRPDGVPYRALDPRLIAWVHTCIPWAVMTAYDRFNQPLSVVEKNQYLAEQSVIGLLGGADEVPTTVNELDAFVENIRGELVINEQTRAFLDFLIGAPLGGALLPNIVPTAIRRRVNRFQLEAGMTLMPRWARVLSGLDAPDWTRKILHEPSLRGWASQMRSAYGVPTFRTMADARVRGEAAAADELAVSVA